MRKFLLAVLFCCSFVLWSVQAFAISASPVELFIDSAPNKYAMPDAFDAWKQAAFTDIENGTFLNMRNGINPHNVGTLNFEIQDEVVYSIPDYGKRLYRLYYLPGETVDALKGTGRIEVSLFHTWDGDTYDYYGTYNGGTWVEPYPMFDVEGGVIGLTGLSWWAAYGVNTQEAVDAAMASWGSVDESWLYTLRLDGEEYSMTYSRSAVPVPATLALFASGLVGLAGLGRRKK